MSLATKTAGLPAGCVGRVDADAHDLAWALKAVLPHASRDETRPEVNAVRFELDGGWLHLIATDRYSLGVARIQAAHIADGEVRASVMLPDARDLLKHVKAEHGNAALYVGSRGEVSLPGRPPCAPVATLAFPDWQRVLGEALHAQPAVTPDRFGFDPALLGRFSAAKEGANLSFRPVLCGEPGPVSGGEIPLLMLVFGERFAGLAAAATLDRSQEPYPVRDLAAWREAVPAPEAGARPETAVA